MSYFKCPHCETTTYDGNIPDQLGTASKLGCFEYDCECGAKFIVQVDWEPEFHVDLGTLKRPPE